MSMPRALDWILRDRSGSLRLICHPASGIFYGLPQAYGQRLATIPHVDNVVGASVFLATYRDPRDMIPSLAVDPTMIEEVWPEWEITPQAAEQFRRVRSAALVEKTLMRRYGWHVGQNLILRGMQYPVDIQLTIAGTLGGSAPPSRIMFRRDLLNEALGRPNTVNLFWIKVDRSDEIPSVIGAIDSATANSSFETRTESEQSFVQKQMGAWRVLFDGAKILAAVVICAITLVAANSAAMSVRERYREIAVMRSIGFTHGLLLFCILSEGLAIALLGGVLGCGAVYLGFTLLPFASGTLGPIALVLKVPRSVMLESLLVAATIGLGSCIGPGISAVRKNISAELRAVT
ncbi:MAG TPA: ABC transporter permease [Candidatus Binataceae bacterium]